MSSRLTYYIDKSALIELAGGKPYVPIHDVEIKAGLQFWEGIEYAAKNRHFLQGTDLETLAAEKMKELTARLDHNEKTARELIKGIVAMTVGRPSRLRDLSIAERVKLRDVLAGLRFDNE